MNNSNFIYVGNVKIKVGKKKYNYRNSGTEYLFQTLARCLCGLFPSIDELPNYLQFRGIKSDGSGSEDLLINPVKVYKDYKDGDKPQCIVTSTIEKTHLKELDAGKSYDNYELQLLNSNKSDAKSFATIAVVNGAQLLESIIDSGKQAFIEWSLSIGNETEPQQDKETK